MDHSYELVVAEGFKISAVTKVLVLFLEKPSPSPENAIAVAGDWEGMENVPCDSLQQLDGQASHYLLLSWEACPPLI